MRGKYTVTNRHQGCDSQSTTMADFSPRTFLIWNFYIKLRDGRV
jgi:hypothetical protein